MCGELPAGKWLGYRDDSERTEERNAAFSTVFESVSVSVFCFSYSLICVLPHWSSPSYHLGAFCRMTVEMVEVESGGAGISMTCARSIASRPCCSFQ